MFCQLLLIMVLIVSIVFDCCEFSSPYSGFIIISIFSVFLIKVYDLLVIAYLSM